MSEHRDDLRSYVFKVARSLVERGHIRRQRGQTVSDLIRAESAVVGREVLEDVVEVLKELGVFTGNVATGALAASAHKGVDRLFGLAGDFLADMIKNQKSRH